MLAALLLPLAASPDDARITEVGRAEPTVLVVEVRYGRAVAGKLRKADDSLVRGEDRAVVQGDRTIGAMVGPKGDLFQPAETLVGKKWDAGLVTGPGSFSITLDGRSVRPLKIGRKSFPHDLAQVGSWRFEAAMTHRFYLRFPSAIPPAARLTVKLPQLPVWTGRLNDRKDLTEGLRVNQVGFRPDDPAKTALWNLWMGSLGASSPVLPPFEVIDDKTGDTVFVGKPSRWNDGNKAETATGELNALGPIYLLDFSLVNKPGTYRLRLPGYGVSYPFRIGNEVWTDAFRIAAKGFYFQRNGIAHSKKFGPYEAPRAFHPDDGQVVYASKTSLMESMNGLNVLGTDKDNFGNLVKGATEEKVANAWGGYKDAGDWDTRVQHLDATRQLLELYEMFPNPVRRLGLNLPESGNGLPDLLNEAQWNLDHYRRMQTPEGGIRGGLEFEEHPRPFEASWMNRMKLFAYAPDPWSSWLYAATAARYAFVLRTLKPELSVEFRTSAVRAFDWGVQELARLTPQHNKAPVRDARNLAAIELLRLTGEAKYEKEFRETTVLTQPEPVLDDWDKVQQGEAASVLVRSRVIPDLVDAARKAIIRQADGVVKRTETTTWRFGHLNEYAYPGYSSEVNPRGSNFLVWAHRATGNDRYLNALLSATGFQVGINPNSRVYTSGVGANPVRMPFMVDPRIAGQPYPPGITVYGPLNAKTEGDGTWFKLVEPFVFPKAREWPAKETHWDCYYTIMMNEFTIMQSLGPTAFVWGYLAYRN